MKTIKMLRRMKVSLNGFTVETWNAGQVYENVPDDIAADLTHTQTLAAILVTGNERRDAQAEEAGCAELMRRHEINIASITMADLAAKLRAGAV